MMSDGGAARPDGGATGGMEGGDLPAALPIDIDDVRRVLGPATYERGVAYQRQGRVRDLVIDRDGLGITAKVQGSQSRPYRVSIRLDGSGRRPPIVADCTCPVGLNCKHAAAALREALDQRPASPVATVPSPRPPLRTPLPDPLEGPVGDWLKSLSAELSKGAGRKSPEQVIYVLDGPAATPGGPFPGGSFKIGIQVVRLLKTGGYGQPRRSGPDALVASTAAYVQPEDKAIGRLLNSIGLHSGGPAASDDADLVTLILRRMIATGRCHWQDKDTPPLTLGVPRRARMDWRLLLDGRQVCAIVPEDEGPAVLPGAAPWYVDPARAEAGPLELDLPGGLIKTLLNAPPIAPHQAQAVAETLTRDLPITAVVPPRIGLVEEIRKAEAVPLLHLISFERPRGAYAHYWHVGPAGIDPVVDLALLAFEYDGRIIDPHSAPHEVRQMEDGRIVVRRRNARSEKATRRRLTELGLVESAETPPVTQTGVRRGFGFPEGRPAWLDFVHRDVPELRAAGWRIEIDPGFRYRVIEADTDWSATIGENPTGGEGEGEGAGAGGWWFSLDLGIEVEGERVPLLPVLVAALGRLRNPTPEGLERIAQDGTLYAPMPDGRHLALPFDRVRGIVSVLIELFDAARLSAGGALTISLGEAAGLAALEDSLRLRWLGSDRLRDLARDLAAFSGVDAVPPPQGFGAVLRPYQQAGLDWLQFLRRYGLGGILADDMGLGKTVQALAHLLVEKQAGRLDRPCLVVCPTSVVPNWRAEAARFAPMLKVLALHGPDRARGFGDIAGADLVLSTYPLLLRDADVLLDRDWHVVILDEAQAIKNPAAKITQTVCRLRARARLCLTGTPIENHLGELWSQFAFLMPGLLGTHKQFTRLFRTAIEKKGDRDRRELLASRLRPFILRRTKSAVAADLPPKTEIVQRIELNGDQRDLYETVRLAMDRKVREAVTAKGLNRSQIVILDALLKLRQACCDPRLVKVAAARRTAGSAKLAALMEMLPELIAEGRRILLFSQFTGMLDLIRPELDRAGLPFVELRGDTADRATPVARFQDGAVPLFLISLKAGGTGLNLTAADTVIHYDPWWNPAVETQATDRAHRIGQDKPVFVYKLIALGTVEERMLDLQERKRALAGVVFDPDSGGSAGFDQADLELLFQPLG